MVSSPQKIPIAAPARTSMIKCTPPMTRRTASPMPQRKRRKAAFGETAIQREAIKKMEKICLLGKDFPFFSLGMRG